MEAILDVIEDPEKLWSSYGIRSLSLNDNYYGVGDNYWRGNIWMPHNFMLLRGLKLFYQDN